MALGKMAMYATFLAVQNVSDAPAADSFHERTRLSKQVSHSIIGRKPARDRDQYDHLRWEMFH